MPGAAFSDVDAAMWNKMGWALVVTAATVTGCSSGPGGEVGGDAAMAAMVDAAVADAAVVDSAVLACPTPGAIESVACGSCGTTERFCTSDRVWAYGECEQPAGSCEPGTTGEVVCGRCGVQPARCDATCSWVTSGECTGEGVCTPGEVVRTAEGCSAPATRVVRCTDACGFGEEVEACSSDLDVVLLVDQTGSHAADVTSHVSIVSTALVGPLLAIPDVSVGVAFMGEFPVAPYGDTGDRPFQGGIEPTDEIAAIEGALEGRPTFFGSDADDATIEALSMLVGGSPAASTIPMSCSEGRVEGGCWRETARRVIIVWTDSSMHNGPDPSSDGVASPYASITPEPARWSAVRDALLGSETTVLWITSEGTSSVAMAQMDEMLTDLGQPLSDRLSGELEAVLRASCATIVGRITALAGR